MRLAGMIRTGRMHRLARDRFPRMPLWPGHPAFEVVSYRTPQGIRAAGDQPWGPPNDACLGFMSELVMGTVHSGAHIDAHAHITIDDRWHGGSAATDLGDFGPLRGDATEIAPLWRRGVLYDVPGHRGVTSLDAGEPVAAGELEAIEAASGVAAGEGDVALVRSGYLAHWPDPEALAAHRGAGPDISAARLLADRGVLAVGSDTETFEVQPAPDRGTPGEPAAGPYPAAGGARDLHPRGPRPRGPRACGRARVPLRRPSAGHPRGHRLDGRPGGDLLSTAPARVRAGLALLAALFVASLALRPQLVGVGPLLPEIEADLGVSHAVAGLLSTIPVICMAVFAPAAAPLTAWASLRTAIAACVFGVAAFGLARAAAPGAGLVLALTLPVGIGIAVAGALLPIAVKARFADRPAFGTGVYTTGLSVGAALASLLAVPLADAFGGWRGALAAFSAATVVLAVGWLVLSRGTWTERSEARAPKLPFRRGIVWGIVAVFGLQSAIFYAFVSWMPDAFQERGWSAATAGALAAVFGLAALPTGLLVPWLADRAGSRRLWLVGLLGGHRRRPARARRAARRPPSRGRRSPAPRSEPCSRSASRCASTSRATRPTPARSPRSSCSAATCCRRCRRSASARCATRPARSRPCCGRCSAPRSSCSPAASRSPPSA